MSKFIFRRGLNAFTAASEDLVKNNNRHTTNIIYVHSDKGVEKWEVNMYKNQSFL